ncbi:MAG TPA: sugar transferase, partial [Acidimicrobiia bacterium]|nr:sugar transferase [Acidimicrobiia bacterium]
MKFRNRFAIETVAADTLSLVAAGAFASWQVYGTVLPWSSGSLLISGQNPRPMVALLLIGVALGSWQSVRVVEPSVPRPLYSRAFTTGFIAVVAFALGIVAMRPYYSQAWTTLALGGWFVLAMTHRAVRRRSTWTENMVIVTDEKALVDDLAESPHANVVDVLEPRGEPPATALAANTTLVVDLRAVLSDQMASFVSSSTLAGYEVRALSSVYEEHTGRLALVHLAAGWEISVPLEKRAPYGPFKRILESLLIIVTSPLWLMLAGLTWLAVKIDSPGPALFRQPRIGFEDRPFTMYKFRSMVVGADDDGPQFTTPDDPR